MGASPAFQFYAKDWIADTRELGPYGRGVLVDMIALCWTNGSVADDAAAVAAAVGAETKQVLKLWPMLRAKFATDDAQPGRLFNRRLEVEREKQAEYRAKQSEKGKASAEARARAKVEQRFNRGSNSGSTAVEAAAQPELQPEPQPQLNSAICDLRSAIEKPVVAGAACADQLMDAEAKPSARVAFRLAWQRQFQQPVDATASDTLCALVEETAKIRGLEVAPLVGPFIAAVAAEFDDQRNRGVHRGAVTPGHVVDARNQGKQFARCIARMDGKAMGKPATSPRRIIGPVEPSDFSDCPAEGRDALAGWKG